MEDHAMPRYIELVLARRELVTRARLLDEAAPATCQAIWEVLPIQMPTIHAWVSGNEIYVVFPWERAPVPRENQTQHAQAGDLFYYYAPWYNQNARSSGEIAIYYDRDSQPLGGPGPMAGTLFAVIDEDLPAFTRACEEIWRDGAEQLEIRRGVREDEDWVTPVVPGRPASFLQCPSPNPNSLRLTVPGTDVTVKIQLFDDLAPRTCAAIRAVVPIEAPSYHSKRSGPEVYITLPPLQLPEEENPIHVPSLGDLVAFSFPPLYRATPFDRADLRATGYTQISLYYRDGAHPTGPEGAIVGTRFGRIDGDAARLYELCAASKSSGQIRLRIDREI
jgi:hypothetical protein